MDNSEDDGIEVIEEFALKERGATHSPVSGPISPEPSSTYFSHRASSQGINSIDPASVHALSTAFTGLQRSHNDLIKKNSELTQKNKSLQRILMDMDFSKIDEQLEAEIPSMAQAAGAIGEGTVSNEQQQAEMGYKRYLTRRVMQSDILLQKSQEEILHLTSKVRELENLNSEIKIERDKLQQDLQILTQNLEQKRIELDQRHEEMQKMARMIQDLEKQLERQRLMLCESETAKINLEDRIELYERTGATNEDRATEIQDLQYRIRISEETIRNLNSQLMEKESLLTKNAGEISRLELKCRQFEIQVSGIRQPQATMFVAGSTGLSLQDFDSDTEVEEIQKALNTVSKTRQNIQGMKTEVEKQTIWLESMKQRQDKGLSMPPSMKMQESRPEVPGSSCHPDFDEPEYKNVGQSPECPVIDSPSPSKGPKDGISNFTRMNPVYGETAAMYKSNKVPLTSSTVFVSRPNSRNDGRIDYNVRDGASSSQRQTFSQQQPDNTIPYRVKVSPERPNPTDIRPSVAHSRSTSDHLEWISQNQPDLRHSRSEVLNVRTKSPDREMRDRNLCLMRSSSSPRFPVENAEMTRFSPRPNGHPAENIIHRNSDPDYENIYNVARDSNREEQHHLDQSPISNPTNSPSDRHRPAGGVVQTAARDLQNVSAVKICPVCSQEFSRLTMDEFQTHVFECFDNQEEGTRTLLSSEQNPVGVEMNEERSCPMCGQVFPSAVSQDTYEGHVLAHFNDEQFEVVHP